MPADIQQALNEYTEEGIGDSPEPLLREPQNPNALPLGECVIEDDAQNSEHEHDLDVPAHNGSEGGLSRCRPESGTLREMENPAIPRLVDEINTENRKSG